MNPGDEAVKTEHTYPIAQTLASISTSSQNPSINEECNLRSNLFQSLLEAFRRNPSDENSQPFPCDQEVQSALNIPQVSSELAAGDIPNNVVDEAPDESETDFNGTTEEDKEDIAVQTRDKAKKRRLDKTGALTIKRSKDKNHYQVSATTIEALVAGRDAALQQTLHSLDRERQAYHQAMSDLIAEKDARLHEKDARLLEMKATLAEEQQTSRQALRDLLAEKDARLVEKDAYLQLMKTNLGQVSQASCQGNDSHPGSSVQKDCPTFEAVGGCLLYELQGHTGWIGGVALSPGSTILASVSMDTTLHLWDTASGLELFTAEHPQPVWRVAVSLDSQWVACGCSEGSIQLWNLATYKKGHTLRGHSSAVTALTFSHNLLASSAKDCSIHLWSIITGKKNHTIAVQNECWSVAFSPDFKSLVFGVGSNAVIWDLFSGSAKYTLEGHLGVVRAVAMSPDGQFVASTSSDKTIRLWTQHGCYVRSMNFPPPETYVPHSLCFSSDSQWLVAPFENGPCRVWNIVTGEIVKEMDCNSYIFLAANKDLALLALPTMDHTIKLYRLQAPSLDDIGPMATFETSLQPS